MEYVRVTCPGSVTGDELRQKKVVVTGSLADGQPLDATVTVENVDTNADVKGGVEWASTQDGFMQVASDDSTPGGVRLTLGHEKYSGAEDERVRIVVTDKTSQQSGSCTLSVSSAETAAEKGSALTDTTPALAVVSLGSATSGMTLGLLASPQCGVKTDLPFSIHPTGLKIDNSKYLGAVVGNIAVMVSLAIFLYALSAAAHSMSGATWFHHWFAYNGFKSFPSVGLYFFLLMYQGTAFTALHLVVYPENAIQFIAGLATTLACVGIPSVVCYKCRMNVPYSAVYHIIKPTDTDKLKEPNVVQLFFFGPGEWVAVERDNMWNDKYMSMLKPYKEKTAWWGVFFFMLMFGVAGLNVPDSDTMVECGHIRMGLAALFVLMLGLNVWKRPYCRVRDNVTFIVLHAAVAAAMVMQGLGFYAEDLNDDRFGVAANILEVCMVVVIVKAVVDLITDSFIASNKTRQVHQDDYWDRKGAQLVDLDEVDPLAETRETGYQPLGESSAQLPLYSPPAYTASDANASSTRDSSFLHPTPSASPSQRIGGGNLGNSVDLMGGGEPLLFSTFGPPPETASTTGYSSTLHPESDLSDALKSTTGNSAVLHPSPTGWGKAGGPAGSPGNRDWATTTGSSASVHPSQDPNQWSHSSSPTHAKTANQWGSGVPYTASQDAVGADGDRDWAFGNQSQRVTGTSSNFNPEHSWRENRPAHRASTMPNAKHWNQRGDIEDTGITHV